MPKKGWTSVVELWKGVLGDHCRFAPNWQLLHLSHWPWLFLSSGMITSSKEAIEVKYFMHQMKYTFNSRDLTTNQQGTSLCNSKLSRNCDDLILRKQWTACVITLHCHLEISSSFLCGDCSHIIYHHTSDSLNRNDRILAVGAHLHTNSRSTTSCPLHGHTFERCTLHFSLYAWIVKRQ